MARTTLGSLLLATPILAQELHEIHGGPNDRLGGAVDGAGDLDGDGLDDFVIAAPDWDPALYEGRVRAYSGADGAILWSVKGPSNGGFGISVSGLGDVNGDGLSDVAVGNWLDDTAGNNAGSVTVFSGLDGAVLYRVDGPIADGVFGYRVEGVGDANGDGVPDLAVGSPNADTAIPQSGVLYMLSGSDGSVIWEAHGQQPSILLGREIGAAGDVNGDGLADVIAGLEFESSFGPNAGSARVFSGLDGSLLYEFFGSAAEDHGGRGVDGAGDVNGDGFDDLLVGFSGSDVTGNLAGEVRIYSGADGSVLRTFFGFAAIDALGSSVAGLGDVDGDGVPDVALGADFSAIHQYFGGHVRVHSGSDGRLLHLFHGDAYQGHFGLNVAGAGDVDGDGLGDLIIGSPTDDTFGQNAGTATVLSGGFVEPAGFCYADGTVITCPCGNLDPGAGCANSTGQGAVLIGTGSPSLTADNLVFTVLGMPPQNFGVIIVGHSPVTLMLGNGTLCIGGSLQRFPVEASGTAGVFTSGRGIPAGVQVGQLPTSYFQAWYRDPFGPCGQHVNVTNALSITWQP